MIRRQTSWYLIDHTKMGIDNRYINVEHIFGTIWLTIQNFKL
jgi:hypothetical protein